MLEVCVVSLLLRRLHYMPILNTLTGLFRTSTVTRAVRYEEIA